MTMTLQTMTVGKRRFVLVPEREFRRLKKREEEAAVRAEFGQEATRALRAYRKTGKAENWSDLKRKLGL